MSVANAKQLRFLAICYHYPPVGSAGTPRTVRLLEAAEAAGFEPVVVTVDPASRLPGFTRDDTYGSDPGTRQIYRFDDRGLRFRLEPKHPKLHRYVWLVGYPAVRDYASAWSAKVRRARPSLISSEGIQAVYVSAPPFSAIGAARTIAQSHNLPLIIDLRDPWNTAPLWPYPTKAHYWLECLLEARALRSAAAIIANTEESALLLVERYPELQGRVVTIPNEATELPPTEARKPNKYKEADQFTIAFVGTLYDGRVLRSKLGGYRPFAVDERPRSLLPVVEALKVLQRTDPQSLRRLRFLIAGQVPAAQLELIERSEFSSNFSLLGRLTHSEARQVQSEADALYINQVAWLDETRSMPHVPGKLFEYLATDKPIVSYVGEGATRRVLRALAPAIPASANANELARALVNVQNSPGRRDPYIGTDAGRQFCELLASCAS